jgi:hypothetical protein
VISTRSVARLQLFISNAVARTLSAAGAAPTGSPAKVLCTALTDDAKRSVAASASICAVGKALCKDITAREPVIDHLWLLAQAPPRSSLDERPRGAPAGFRARCE